MSLNPSTVKVGDVLYSMSREKMGNTTLSRDRVTRYVVKAINGPEFLLHYGGHSERHTAYFVGKLRRSPKEWCRFGLGLDGVRCAICLKTKDDGHAADCDHPAAVKARKAKGAV